MLTRIDEEWLRASYPGLTPSPTGVAGRLEFRAAYNSQTEKFAVLQDGFSNTVGGIELAVSYGIRIIERSDTTFSQLPALYIDGLEPTTDRHFNQRDKSACLCSPLAEREYLLPAFAFAKFLEQLVIPFLYGQCFHSREHRWPWDEYAHGITGLLESYADADEDVEVKALLGPLLAHRGWPQVKNALLREKVKGHIACFCSKGDMLRRCHPKALRGLRRLHASVRTGSVLLP